MVGLLGCIHAEETLSRVKKCGPAHINATMPVDEEHLVQIGLIIAVILLFVKCDLQSET